MAGKAAAESNSRDTLPLSALGEIHNKTKSKK